MKNLIATLVIVLVLALAIFYIVKQKKSGAKCIGCPSGGCCPSKKGGKCNCDCNSKD